MHVTLAPDLERFVQQKVAEGEYASAGEMIATSLALLRTDEDEEWKASAREKIEQGLLSAREGRVHTPEAVIAWMKEQRAPWLVE